MLFQNLLKSKNSFLQQRVQSVNAIINDLKEKFKSTQLSYKDVKQSCSEYQDAKKCLLTQKFSAWFVSLTVSHNMYIRITKSHDYEKFKLDF
jgi:aspartate ammonia-lyase